MILSNKTELIFLMEKLSEKLKETKCILCNDKIDFTIDDGCISGRCFHYQYYDGNFDLTYTIMLDCSEKILVEELYLDACPEKIRVVLRLTHPETIWKEQYVVKNILSNKDKSSVENIIQAFKKHIKWNIVK